jgi:hypothetical protein
MQIFSSSYSNQWVSSIVNGWIAVAKQPVNPPVCPAEDGLRALAAAPAITTPARAGHAGVDLRGKA